MEYNNNNNEQWKLLVLLLKEIAESKGITQQEIADNTGLLQSNVNRFFALKYKPTLDTFLKIAKVINVNFFFEDQEGKTDLNLMFEKAINALGRRTDNLPKNLKTL
ncbi:helix-turn-helix domain-containing protein [Flavobacterium sp. CBA20B-1]|uniref:helix-turn-helix domain-containing protein n=1 Tax=unclassified Flavobacterium TaxID=196869 RepID=UPI002225882A|nr:MULTISPECIES: helix-turn-helix transcriptional regulator [unclassified Flavobacterium]WCM42419.1 helix-turn-helix domain-containing protein [Flavobacterium sp. CBA20B-1]